MKQTKQTLNRADIMRLAAETGLDPRTIQRAIDRGVESIRAVVDRERLVAAALKLKLPLE